MNQLGVLELGAVKIGEREVVDDGQAIVLEFVVVSLDGLEDSENNLLVFEVVQNFIFVVVRENRQDDKDRSTEILFGSLEQLVDGAEDEVLDQLLYPGLLHLLFIQVELDGGQDLGVFGVVFEVSFLEEFLQELQVDSLELLEAGGGGPVRQDAEEPGVILVVVPHFLLQELEESLPEVALLNHFLIGNLFSHQVGHRLQDLRKLTLLDVQHLQKDVQQSLLDHVHRAVGLSRGYIPDKVQKIRNVITLSNCEKLLTEQQNRVDEAGGEERRKLLLVLEVPRIQ